MTSKPTARKRRNVPWTDTPFQRHAKMVKRIELETRAKTTAIHDKLSLRIKLTRLVASWRSDADNQGLLRSDKPRLVAYGKGRRDCLRRCADQLQRILKP